jgi:hypothetical protein
MSKANKQSEAANHIQELLNKGGHSIGSRKITLEDNRHWIVFEYGGRQIGIDSDSGLWIRESSADTWICIAMPCTVSGAIQAVEFFVAG